MALTDNNKALIQSIASNDFAKAKTAAIASLVEDTSKKNSAFCARYKKILMGEGQTIVDQIPPALKYKLIGYMPEDFREDRYYLADREAEISERIIRMRAVAEEMQALQIRYINSVLLYGVSGTGKTMFGQYVASKMELPYFYINFSQTVDSLMGKTAQNISQIFQFIKRYPCVLMLDEIDCIAMRRRGGASDGPSGELERTTISLMQELDQLPNTVTLLAATNRPDCVDEALMRRFSVKHEVQKFSKKENTEMIRKFLSTIDITFSISDEEIEKLADQNIAQSEIMLAIIKKIGDYLYKTIDRTHIRRNQACT